LLSAIVRSAGTFGRHRSAGIGEAPLTGSNGEATANICFTSATQHHTVVAKIEKIA
jgi:hypothetical protein